MSLPSWKVAATLTLVASLLEVVAGPAAHGNEDDPSFAVDDRPGYVSDMGGLPATSEANTEAISVADGDLAPAPSTIAGNAAVASISPNRCRGHSSIPHQSTSFGTYGEMKGFAKTYCENPIPFMEVEAWIWRRRWWGYQKMGDRGYGGHYWDMSIGRSGHWAGCETNMWRTVGRHHVRDIDGRDYALETQHYKDWTCW